MTLYLWLVPLVGVIAPTALTLEFNTYTAFDAQCSVPHIDFTQSSLRGSMLRVREAHGGINEGGPSPTAYQSVELPARMSTQNTWKSPCGTNCSSATSFIAPSWRCNGVDFLDSRIPWIIESQDPTDPDIPFWGTTLSQAGNLTSYTELVHFYIGMLDNNTNWFWVGCGNYTDWEADAFDIPVTTFYCRSMNSSYELDITYTNGKQQVSISTLADLNQIAPYNNGQTDSSYSDGDWQARGLILPLVHLLQGNGVM